MCCLACERLILKKETTNLKKYYWFRAKWVYNLVGRGVLAQSWTARRPQRPSTLVYIRWCPLWRHTVFWRHGAFFVFRQHSTESDWKRLFYSVVLFINSWRFFLHRLTILIRVKANAWRFNQLDNGVLPCKTVFWPYTVPSEIPWPFIRPSKQIRRLLASLLYNGQASFPTLRPFSGAGKFSLSAHPMPYAIFFTHNLSIKRHRVAFMRMWISLPSAVNLKRFLIQMKQNN